MSHDPRYLPPRYLRTPEAARFVGLSGRTLEKHRTYGTGPRYSKIVGRVVYRLDDHQTWVDQGRKNTTSDVSGDDVLPARQRELALAPRLRSPPQRTRVALWQGPSARHHPAGGRQPFNPAENARPTGG